MPVIFRGNIPPCCGWCAELRREYDGVCWCNRMQKQISEVVPPYDKRMEWCPIIAEIPYKHGKIIDVTTLKSLLNEDLAKRDSDIFTARGILRILDSIPAILEADVSK